MSPVLTDEDHRHFIEHGYVVLKGAVPEDLRRAAIQVLEQSNFEGSPGAGDYKPVRDPALDACLTPDLVRAVEEIAGGACPAISPPHDRPRPYSPETPWRNHGPHVDQNDPSPVPTFYDLGMFIFLTPVRERGGAFQYAHGSPRRLRSLITQYPTESLVTANLQADLVGDVEEFLADAGDVILFQHMMVHCGSDNVTDPTCRRALEVRFALPEPIRPGDKPFDQMSTLEKANSPSYLAATFDTQMVLPRLRQRPGADQALGDGFGGDGGLLAQVATREDGWTSLYYVEETAPSNIRRIRSRDWITWEDAPPIVPPIDGRILSLQAEHRRLATLTVATDRGSVVLESQDHQRWSVAARADGLRLARPRFVLLDMADDHARSDVAFHVDTAAAPNEVRYRFRTDERQEWAQGLAGFEQWPHEGVAYRAEPGTQIDNVIVMPTTDLARYALVADVDRGQGPRAEAATSSVTDRFDRLEPLTFPEGTPARQVRPFEIGKDLWLATYLRDHDDDARACWARVDWRDSQPRLTRLDTVAALRDCLYDVGLL